MVESGAFREDLFYRLNGASLKLPPLRERADKAFLIDRVFAELAEGRPGNPHLRGDAISALLAYPWPGNIRELRNVLQRAQLFATGPRIEAGDLNLPRAAAPRAASPAVDPDRSRIEAALAHNHGIIAQTAAELGLSRQALYRRMDRYGIPRE